MEDGDEPTEIEGIEDEVQEEEEDEGIRNYQEEQLPTKKCNERLDELAMPPRRMFLALYNAHAYHFPPEKVEYLKNLLQKLYAMTPEEAAKYFEEVRAEAKKAALRRKLKQKLRKLLMDRKKQKQRCKAYKLFRKLLKCGIRYAVENPIPPLVSLRLRYLSDVVLEQLCFLREIPVPNRANPCIDDLGTFMISVADWMAIAIEKLYFAAQSAIDEHERQKKGLTSKTETKYWDADTTVTTPYILNKSSFLPKKGTSTPRGSFDDTFAGWKPISTSTPKGSLDNTFAPKGTSTPKGSLDNTFAPKGTSTPKGSFNKTSVPKTASNSKKMKKKSR